MDVEEGQTLVTLDKDQVLCQEGDSDSDLYLVHSGKLMVCLSKGSQITPVAYIGPGQYLGELSFFDGSPRSASVIAMKECLLIKMQTKHLESMVPAWLRTCAISITKRLRKIDEVVNQKGIRRTNVDSIKPLSIEDQKKYYHILQRS